MDALEQLSHHAQELQESFNSTIVVGSSTFGMTQYVPVSYTHLTLPTICSV